MAELVRLVSLIGGLSPEAFDAIFPHRHVLAQPEVAVSGRPSRAVLTALNPQPLPPKDALTVATAELAHRIAFAAVAAEASGNEGASQMVITAVDDWCGTPHPRRPIPWPHRWPFPFPKPDPEPEPHPDWDVSTSLVVGALSLAAAASTLADGDVRESLAKGAEQMLDAALAGQP